MRKDVDVKRDERPAVTRRALFAGLGAMVLIPSRSLEAPAAVETAILPRIAYDQWVTCGRSDVGGYTELSQYYVESKAYPNRGRKVWVRLVLSTGVPGYILDWQTYEDFYVNGVWKAQIPPNWSSVKGPGTVYNPANGQGVSFMVNGGGHHKVTKHSTAFRPGAVTGNDFKFTITLPYLIVASAGTGGKISSPGDTYVNPGGSKGYTATPSAGYRVASLVVDGRDLGAKGAHTFSDVQADHTIKATFARIFHTVTFKEGHGQNRTLKTEKVPHGGDATAPASPSRAGWSFKGWDRGYRNVTSDITVTALWAPAAVVRYFADGELRYSQGGLTPGADVSVPGAAVDACRREGCTPGWTGWFSDPGCSRAWRGGKVPAGTLNLYSYNMLTVSFAPTDDCAPLDGTFRTVPRPEAPMAVTVPAPVESRWGRELSLSLPPACYREDGDGRWATMRAQGYFGDKTGTGSPTSRISPGRDVTLHIRWVEAVVDGVESMRP